MPATWYLDEGLATLRAEWRRLFPNSVVYTIGDGDHSKNPDVSQHAPDRGGSQPGDDAGEVDAADFMPGNGVTHTDLKQLFEGLVDSRDARLLYVIYQDKIVSSVVSPWTVRKYAGAWHGHVHVSVNDRFDANTADWRWEPDVARTLEYSYQTAKLPNLRFGDEDDILPGFNQIHRAQSVANYLDGTLPPLDVDGVYGAKSVAKFARIFKTDGRTLGADQWRVLYGLS